MGFYLGGWEEGGFMIYPLIWLPISTLILIYFSYLGIFFRIFNFLIFWHTYLFSSLFKISIT